MRKRYPKTRWQPPGSRTASEISKTSRITLWTERLSLIRKIILDLSFFGLLLGFGIVTYHEFNRDQIILYPIEIPEELKKSGYTGKIITEKLYYELRKIEMKNLDLAKNASLLKSVGNQNPGLYVRDIRVVLLDEIPDIQIPGTDFSFRTLLTFVKKALGIGRLPQHISGGIFQTSKAYRLSLRINSEPSKSLETQTEPIFNLDDLLEKQGGETLYNLTHPIMLAIQTFNLYKQQFSSQQNNNTTSADSFKELTEFCLNNPPTTDDALAYYLQGWASLKYDKNDDAIKKFNKARELAPKAAYPYIGLGVYWHNLEQYDEAIANYQKAIELDPNNAAAYNNWGNSLDESNCYNEAIGKFEKAIERDPTFAYAYNNLGNSLIHLGISSNHKEFYKKAITNLEKAIELDPNYANAYNNLGESLNGLERYKEATAKYKKATELNPQHAVAFYNWGLVLERLGKPDYAKEKFKQAKKLDPNINQKNKNYLNDMNNHICNIK